MAYLHVPIPREQLDWFHGLARSRGLTVKSKPPWAALKLWAAKGIITSEALPASVSGTFDDPYAHTPEAEAVFDTFIAKVVEYQKAVAPVIDTPPTGVCSGRRDHRDDEPACPGWRVLMSNRSHRTKTARKLEKLYATKAHVKHQTIMRLLRDSRTRRLYQPA